MEDGAKKLRSRHVTMITLGGIIGASLSSGPEMLCGRSGRPRSSHIDRWPAGLPRDEDAGRDGGHPPGGRFVHGVRPRRSCDWAAYIVGWLYWYFWVGVIAFEVVVGGAILHGWMPGLPPWAFSILLLLIFTGINLVSLRSFGKSNSGLPV